MAPIIPSDPNLDSSQKLKIIIRNLLLDIRDSKGIVDVAPALTENDFDNSIFHLTEHCPSQDFKVLLECATRSILLEIAVQPPSPDRLSSFCVLLDLTVVLSEIGVADITLPFLLIEDLFDSQTIDTCKRLFEYLEARVDRLTANLDGLKGKGPVLLRMCNELLRRLSKAEDTIFCGRILILLSKSFILGERSGVNLRGEFNTENTTSYDQKPLVVEDEAMDVDAVVGSTVDEAIAANSEAEVTVTVTKTPSDDPVQSGKTVSPNTDDLKAEKEVPSADSLYPTFWSLQNYFSNPTKLFERDAFDTFKSGLAATIFKFKAIDEEQQKQGAINGAGDDGRSRGTGVMGAVVSEKRKRPSENDPAAHFNPKYLTSRELFDLELRDLTFRRHVLVQALIIIDFLLSLTPVAKARWANIQAPNKSVQFAFTLSSDDESWATSTRGLICEYLQPNLPGRLFMRLVETILTRDKNWVQWKAENCQSFERIPVPVDEVEHSIEQAMKFCTAAKPYAHRMGAPALGRLWRDAGKNPGMKGLRQAYRNKSELQEFRSSIKEAEYEVSEAVRTDDAENAATVKASRIWRALRVTSKDRFHLFNKLVDTVDEDRNELEMLFEVEDSDREAKRSKLEDGGVKDKASMYTPTIASQSLPSFASTDTKEHKSSREAIKEQSVEDNSSNKEHGSSSQQIDNPNSMDSDTSLTQSEMKLHRIESSVTS